MSEARLRLPLILVLGLGACTANIEGGDEPMPGTGPMQGAGGTAGRPGTGGTGGNAPFVPSTPVKASRFDAMCKGGATIPTARLWRLTARQYNNTLRYLLGDTSSPADGKDLLGADGQTGFQNGAAEAIQDGDANQLRLVAKNVAEATVTSRASKVFPPGCDTKPNDANCAKQFVAEFGKRAFRRPLTTAENERYLALYTMAEPAGANLGARAVIESMLQSPNFLFRTELGTGTGKVRLTTWEIAAALSYTFLDSMPDDQLLAAAETNKLSTPAELEAQVTRLLATDDRTKDAFGEFFRQYLELEELHGREKDTALFPDYTAALKKAMEEEVLLFTKDVLFNGNGNFETLFTANYTFANDAIGKLYGVPVTGTAFKKITTKAEERAGLLTMPALMSHLAANERTSPVNRGRFVQERLFCTVIPPPIAADTNIPALPPNLTRRQQLDAQTSGPTCAPCHERMNPIGFGLENMDAIGRFRATEENNLPIDTSGILKADSDVDGPFRGAREMAMKIASSQKVKECFTVQSFRYLAGRGEAESSSDACALKTMHERFSGAAYDVKQLAVAYVLSETFSMRQR